MNSFAIEIKQHGDQFFVYCTYCKRRVSRDVPFRRTANRLANAHAALPHPIGK